MCDGSAQVRRGHVIVDSLVDYTRRAIALDLSVPVVTSVPWDSLSNLRFRRRASILKTRSLFYVAICETVIMKGAQKVPFDSI